MSGLDDAGRLGMLIACLQQETPAAFEDWARLNVHSFEDMLNLSISLTSIASTWLSDAMPIPEGAAYAVPPGLDNLAEADAYRAVILLLNGDPAGASGLLQGVLERGDIIDVCIHLTDFARSAVMGHVIEVPL